MIQRFFCSMRLALTAGLVRTLAWRPSSYLILMGKTATTTLN